MRTALAVPLLFRTRGNPYSAFVQSLNPTVWLRFTETSGTTAVNSGSGGSTYNGSIGGTTTVGQTGKLGASEAILTDALTSVVTVNNGAAIQGLTNFTLIALVYPNNAGENNQGRFCFKLNEFDFRIQSASMNLTGIVNCATTNAVITTSTTIATSAWSAVTLRYNDSTKNARAYINGTEAAYTTNQTAVGARVSNTNALLVANQNISAFTFDGLFDELLVIPSVVSADEILRYAQLAGVA